MVGLRGAVAPDAGLFRAAAREICEILKAEGVADMPLGVDIVEPPMLAALADEGLTVLDAQQVMLDAREVKSVDEILLLNTACAMVDGAYQMISEQLKPGVRESELVANVTKFLFDLGSEHVDNINAVSGERCSPHPHVFSDRIIRPGDQAFFDIIHTFVGYKTCYYRTFVVGKANDAQRDAYKRAREWIDASIELMRPGVTTDQVASVWPKAEEFGFDNEMECFGLQFGHSVGLFLHERPIISRLNSLDHPVELKEGMVIALETYCPAKDGVSAARIEEEVVITADRPAGHHPLPVRRAVRRERVLGAGADGDDRAGHRSRHPPPDVPDDGRSAACFEVRAQELFFEGLVRGTTHLGVGQEAVAAGRRGGDARGRLHVLHLPRPQPHARPRRADGARSSPSCSGAATGLLGGKGGSMHLTSVEHGAMGSYAIVGAHLPIALGAAWSAQYRKSGQVAVCFFGDGTTNIGAFHEALNMAAVWKAPVVFVCENNQYMEYTPIGAVTAVRASGRGPGVGLRPRADRRRRQRRRRRVRGGADAPSTGRGPATGRRSSRRSRTATAATRAPIRASTGPTTRSRRGRRATRSRPTGRGCSRRGVDGRRPRRHRRGDARGRRGRRGRGARRAGARRRRARDPGLERTEARRGGTDLSRGHRRGHRPGDGARPDASSCIGEDVGAAGGVFKLTEGLFDGSGPSASATRRSASRRSSAPRWAPR